MRARYADFGPTFAREKLVEVHGYRLSVECVGDLVQIDGSPHAWFEGRGPVCTLIVYIDDATSRLLALGFFAAETTEAYMETTRAHLAAHGRPVAYYSDRYGVFRVNKTDQEGALTQFSRALRTLDIGRSRRAARRRRDAWSGRTRRYRIGC